MIIRRANISASRRVTISCADDLTGNVNIVWTEPSGPAPAIAGLTPRPMACHEASVPITALTRGFDNCWPAKLPAELPPAVAAAAMATLAVEQVRHQLNKLLAGEML